MTTVDGLIETQEFGSVLEIRMVKPKVNAICRRLSRALFQAASHLQDASHLTVGILTAPGERAFSAGWDFNEVAAYGSAEGPVPGGFGGITSLSSLKKPLIAAVNGPAVGGGFELALACDMIIMVDHAYFQLPEMQRGILPDAGGVQRLPRHIPYNVAVEMIYTGRQMPAEEALRWGLAAAVCSRSELDERARALAQRVAKGAPLALQAFKEVMRAIDRMPITEAMKISQAKEEGLETYRSMQRSEDAIEGPRAFLERRPPNWRGQ
jgi:crotonobetainyl-CoA hydratase